MSIQDEGQAGPVRTIGLLSRSKSKVELSWLESRNSRVDVDQRSSQVGPDPRSRQDGFEPCRSEPKVEPSRP